MRAAFGVLVGALVISFPLSAEWRVAGRIGGLITAVAAHHSFVYVAVGSRLNVYDVTDPAAPLEVGSTPFFGDDVTDVLVDDARAYVAAGTDGIYIVDISDRSVPHVIGHWDSPGTAEGIARDGTWIFVADGPLGLQAVDASDPAAPKAVGSAFDTKFAFDVAIHDHYAFIAGADAGLLVVDVTDPTNLREAVVLDTPGYARDLAISGTTLYLADQWGGVRVMSIATPFNPREIAVIPLPSWAFAVTVSGSTLHVAAGARGLHAYDVADPASPQEADAYPLPLKLSWKAAISNGRAFVGVRTQSVEIFDVTQPAALQQVGRIAPLIRAGSIALRGDVVYVSTAEQDVRVIDISQPERMRERGAGFTVNGTVGQIAMVGSDYVYLATSIDGRGHVAVYDVRDIDRPAFVTSKPLFNFARELIVRDSFLYIPDEYGLEVFDVANPASPVLKGELRFEPDNAATLAATSVALAGPYAFVSAGPAGLKIIDVSDPARMGIVGSWSDDSISQLAYRDGLLYAATGSVDTQLIVLDVSDPLRPVRRGSASLAGRSVGDILLEGPYAYVANGSAGVAVIDVRDPLRPSTAATIQIPGFATQLAVERGRLLVTASNGGLVVVEPAAQQPTSVSPARVDAAPLRHPPVAGPRFSPVPRPSRGPAARSPVIAGSGRNVVVTSAADSGPGTLREALTRLAAGDAITFDAATFPPSSPVTIQLATVFPNIKRAGVVIDASRAGVILDGSRLSGLFESGLEFEAPSTGNIVRGLQIVNFPSCGIFIGGDGGNIIGGDRARGAAPTGEGNVLSRNVKAGIMVANPNGNVIVGNLIGTDVTGRIPLGHQAVGVRLFVSQALGADGPGDRVGGYDTWERNVIAGNESAEVGLHFGGSNSVIGNYIGTDVDGNAIGTAFRAISIDASPDNVITENVVVGNHSGQIIDSGACCNHFIRNWFGVTPDGRVIPRQIGSGDNGLAINESFNLIFGNVFGGIRYHSIFLTGQAATVVETIIAGNTIIGSSPPHAFPGNTGIAADAASRMFVGGSTAAFGNFITGGETGIALRQGVARTFILRNFVGVDEGASLQMKNGLGVGTSASTFVQNNTFANMSGTAIAVGSPTNRIRQNSFYGNETAIEVAPEADVPAPPIIREVTLATVTGTACGGCTVEIFSDVGMQARWYEGTTVADGSGRFTFERTFLRDGWIVAAATDARGSSSALSTPVAAPPVPRASRQRAVRR